MTIEENKDKIIQKIKLEITKDEKHLEKIEESENPYELIGISGNVDCDEELNQEIGKINGKIDGLKFALQLLECFNDSITVNSNEDNRPKFIVKHNGKVHEFQCGSYAYLYDIAVCNNITDDEQIMEMINSIEECYRKDDNQTPLGSLADYVIANWESVKDSSPKDILFDFYSD